MSFEETDIENMLSELKTKVGDPKDLIIMSSEDKLAFLLTMLCELKEYQGPECSMVSITLAENDKTCPELLQLINNHDGTFLLQHLAETTHKTIKKEIILMDDLHSLNLNVDKAIRIELTWGPFVLVEYM